MKKGFMVIFDDDQGVLCPYCLDPDCEGALIAWLNDANPVVVFPDRASANRAIRISVAAARLAEAQGAAVNTDFLGGLRKCIKVVPVCIKEKGGDE